MLRQKRTIRKRMLSVEPRGEIQKGSTGGTAVGAKPGRTNGNKQKAKYLESDGRHGKPGRKEEEKQKSEREAEKPKKPTVRQKRWKRGKEEAEAE